MRNPWLDIPLADYEAHMGSSPIGQSKLIADQLDSLIRAYSPSSVAIIGCSGGNGFDRLIPTGVERVVGIDLNPEYIAEARRRYHGRIRGLELHVGDIQAPAPLFEPVDLIYAALLFEYVDSADALNSLRRHCNPNGAIAALLQVQHPTLADISPSPYTSLQRLEPAMRLVPREDLVRQAIVSGLTPELSKAVFSPAGKQFSLETFRIKPGLPAGA